MQWIMASHRTERVFCISIRKDIDTGYTFPLPIESDTVLMDKLEPVDNIEDKYFLSNECVLIKKPTDGVVKQAGYIKKSENGTQHQSNTVYYPNGAARTLTACDYKSPMMIKE